MLKRVAISDQSWKCLYDKLSSNVNRNHEFTILEYCQKQYNLNKEYIEYRFSGGKISNNDGKEQTIDQIILEDDELKKFDYSQDKYNLLGEFNNLQKIYVGLVLLHAKNFEWEKNTRYMSRIIKITCGFMVLIDMINKCDDMHGFKKILYLAEEYKKYSLDPMFAEYITNEYDIY